MPGMGELVIILLIVLVVFGANKLPGIGDALGRSIKNFKRSSKVEGAEDDDDKDDKAEVKQLPASKAAAKELAAAPIGAVSASADGEDAEWEEVVVRRRKKAGE